MKEIAGERQPHMIWMEFDSDSVGRDARSKRYCPNPLWTPVAMCIKSFQYRKNISINIDILQFPTVPAEGLTIHKSQGATYKSVAVHLRSRMDRALLYVALSRATATSGQQSFCFCFDCIQSDFFFVLFIHHHLESCLAPSLATTNEFTQIDWAYANIIRPRVITASVYETVFSYHNPIFLEAKEILSDKSFAIIKPTDQSQASELHS